MKRLRKKFLKSVISIFFLFGILMLTIGAYTAWRTSITRSISYLLGLGLLSLGASFVIYELEIQNNKSVMIRGKLYSIDVDDIRESIISNEEGGITPRENSENIDTIISLLNGISEEVETQEEELQEYYHQDATQYLIDVINSHLALQEYMMSSTSDNGLRVVGFENELITAQSEEEIDLAEGLIFNILSDERNECLVTGWIGTAELIAAESSSGKLFQFKPLEWKHNEGDWKGLAKEDLKNGRARLDIPTDDLVEIEGEILETTLYCLQKIKQEGELEYDY